MSEPEFCTINLKYVNMCFFCISSHNRGNLIEILKWAAQTDPLARAVLEDSAANATYLSHHIQNELLHIMADQIRDKIAEKVRKNF